MELIFITGKASEMDDKYGSVETRCNVDPKKCLHDNTTHKSGLKTQNCYEKILNGISFFLLNNVAKKNSIW